MKAISLIIISFVCTVSSIAQTHSAFRMDFLPYVGVYNFQSGSDVNSRKLSSIVASIKFNYSLFGQFYDDDSKFFFADVIGAEFGIGTLNLKKNSDPNSNSYGGVLGLEFGLAAGYALSKEIEFGIKYYYGSTYITDIEEAGSISLFPVIVPSVKWNNVQLNLGFGNGQVGGIGFKTKTADAISLDLRYFIGSSSYLSVRYDAVSGTAVYDSNVKEKANAIMIGFGMLPSAW
jgi:hypothetical protein